MTEKKDKQAQTNIDAENVTVENQQVPPPEGGPVDDTSPQQGGDSDPEDPKEN